MEKAPDYRPLIAWVLSARSKNISFRTDLIPKETELFYLMLSKRAPSGTREPFLCSQCLQLFNTYPVFEKHLKEKHGCDLWVFLLSLALNWSF
jgi:hypothetical protein